jgi:hypothetical protein
LAQLDTVLPPGGDEVVKPVLDSAPGERWNGLCKVAEGPDISRPEAAFVKQLSVIPGGFVRVSKQVPDVGKL